MIFYTVTPFVMEEMPDDACPHMHYLASLYSLLIIISF